MTIRPVGILVHRCESGHTGDEVRAAEAKQGLGYHYFIDKVGQVDVLYPPTQLVWHARMWSRACIGIAVYGDFDAVERSVNSQPSLTQMRALVHTCIELWHTFGPLPIFGHTDLSNSTHIKGKRCPGANMALDGVRRAVFENYALVQAGKQEAAETGVVTT